MLLLALASLVTFWQVEAAGGETASLLLKTTTATEIMYNDILIMKVSFYNLGLTS